MNEQIRICNMVATSTNGVVTSQQIRDAGIHPHYLHELVRSVELQTVCRGVYLRNDT